MLDRFETCLPQASLSNNKKLAINMLKDAHFHVRHLPHIYIPEATYFITYRLYGSIPIQKIIEIRNHLDKKYKPHTHFEKYIKDEKYFEKYDKLLNSGKYGKSYLKNNRIAKIVKDSINYYDGKDYNLICYTIMPNHVHLVFALLENSRTVDKIMQSVKRYSARESNKILKREGSFWQAESYDHIVRDEEELNRIINYVIQNPVKAGIAEKWEDWAYTYLRLG